MNLEAGLMLGLLWFIIGLSGYIIGLVGFIKGLIGLIVIRNCRFFVIGFSEYRYIHMYTEYAVQRVFKAYRLYRGLIDVDRAYGANRGYRVLEGM